MQIKDMDKKLKIRDWLLELSKKDKITFSTDDIFRQNPAWTEDAVASSLKRLV
jgi:hypothetical protein